MFECASFGGYWYGTSREELVKSDFVILEPQGVAYFRKNYPEPLHVILLERTGIAVDPRRMARDSMAGFDTVAPDYIVRGDTVEEMSNNLIHTILQVERQQQSDISSDSNLSRPRQGGIQMRKHRYENIDIIAFLEEQMKRNTKFYQSDFDIDRKVLLDSINSAQKEDRTFLWLSRECGTNLARERDTFIKGSDAYTTWQYYAAQEKSSVCAFAVEVSGEENGILRGNCYELDYRAHAAEVASLAAEPAGEEKTFADGTVTRLPFGCSHYVIQELAEKHGGSVVASKAIPQDEQRLQTILSAQKATRNKQTLREYLGRKPTLSNQLKRAESKSSAQSALLSTPEKDPVR